MRPPAAPGDDTAVSPRAVDPAAINAVMFVVELGAGIWARSAGLVADAMDMFADAAVYGVALTRWDGPRKSLVARAWRRCCSWCLLGALAEVVPHRRRRDARSRRHDAGIRLLALSPPTSPAWC